MKKGPMIHYALVVPDTPDNFSILSAKTMHDDLRTRNQNKAPEEQKHGRFTILLADLPLYVKDDLCSMEGTQINDGRVTISDTDLLAFLEDIVHRHLDTQLEHHYQVEMIADTYEQGDLHAAN